MPPIWDKSIYSNGWYRPIPKPQKKAKAKRGSKSGEESPIQLLKKQSRSERIEPEDSASRPSWGSTTFRTKLSTRSSDPANFPRDRLLLVWGEFPPSLIRPGATADDWHHAISRGYEFGAGPSHPLRYVFSSILGAIPVDRYSHDQAALRDFDLRCLLVNAAIDKVMQAVNAGRIELLERDHLFLKLFRLWRENPNKPKLLTNLL